MDSITSPRFITYYRNLINRYLANVQEQFVGIRVPKDVVEGARIPENEFEGIARVELAIALYARGILGLGQARRLAGLTKWELLEELAKRRVERHYTRKELEDDLTFAEA